MTTKSKLTTAIGLVRKSREMRKAARGCRGFRSGADRHAEADRLYAKAMWVLGRVSDQDYQDWLRG